MPDRQTKRIVQVCRDTDQEEKAPGPSIKVILLGGGGLPVWAKEKKEKYHELRDGRHRRQGQDRELYPILPLNREVLHCNTPPTPKRSRETHRQQAKKKSALPKKDRLMPCPPFFRGHRRIGG